MYAKVENGNVTQIGLPQVGTLADGRVVSGYDMLDADTLAQEGWLPLEVNQPAYDAALQDIQFSGYEIQADKIISNFIAVDKPMPEPIPDPPPAEPTTQEQLDDLVATLVEKGVIY